MARYNTVRLRPAKNDVFQERRAGATLYPGYLVMINSSGQVIPHNVRGGKAAHLFPRERYLEGDYTVESPYVSGEWVPVSTYPPGEEIAAILKKGENVAKGDWLISNGDGTLIKAASGYLADVVADSAAVTNTVAETTFSNGTVAIPANSLRAGDIIRVYAAGYCPSTNATDTLNVKLKIGTTVVAQTGALDVANNDVFILEIRIYVRTIGATGTVVASGYVSIGTPGTATAKVVNLASTVVDTTVAQSLTVTATWSVANAGDQAVLQALTVERVAAAVNAGAVAGGDVVAYANEALNLSAATADAQVAVELT